MNKDSNPKQTYGDVKVGLSSVPMGPLYALAVAMAEGGMKYGKHNYRDIGCKHSTYFDAAMGHLVSWHEGEDIDEESGIHHLMKAAACMFVMYDSILMKNDNDDRPIRYPEGVPLRINEAIAKLKEKYPDPVEPFTQKGKKNKGLKAMVSQKDIDKWRNPLKMLLPDPFPAFKQFVPPTPDPTEEEIDRVLEYMFSLDRAIDFLIVERQAGAKMTRDKLAQIERILGRDGGSELNCSDCMHYVPYGNACLEGKLLLTANPKVDNCPNFEREPHENK